MYFINSVGAWPPASLVSMPMVLYMFINSIFTGIIFHLVSFLCPTIPLSNVLYSD